MIQTILSGNSCAIDHDCQADFSSEESSTEGKMYSMDESSVKRCAYIGYLREENQSTQWTKAV